MNAPAKPRPPKTFLTPHAVEAYHIFYPSADRTEMFIALMESDPVDADMAQMLFGRSSVPSSSSAADQFWLHPERSGVFVLIPRRVYPDETEEQLAKFAPFVCVTFLRFFALRQHQLAIETYGTRATFTARASYVLEVNPNFRLAPEGAAAQTLAAHNPITWADYTLQVSTAARRLGVRGENRASFLGQLTWRRPTFEERVAGGLQRHDDAWITEINQVAVRLLVLDGVAQVSQWNYIAPSKSIRPAKFDAMRMTVCAEVHDHAHSDLSFEGCVLEIRRHLARCTPTQAVDDRGLVWHVRYLERNFTLYQPFPGQWHLAVKMLTLTPEQQDACVLLREAGVELGLPKP